MKRKAPHAKGSQPIPFPAEAAMHRAARRAREIARRFGTPIYVLRDGKIIAVKP